MPSILFICTANRYRSPLAAAFFKGTLPGGLARQWVVDSAGTWTRAGLPALPEAVRLASSYGLDIQKHRTKPVDADLIGRTGLVLCMEGGHKEALRVEFPRFKERIFCLSEAAEDRQYDIPDPFEADGSLDESVGRELYHLIRSKQDNILKFATRLDFPA